MLAALVKRPARRRAPFLKFSADRPLRLYREQPSRGALTTGPNRMPTPLLIIRLSTIGRSCRTSLRHMRDMTCRERDFLVGEFSQIGGLMPLLMKRRNQGAWTDADKAELDAHMKRLRALSPYLVLTAMPGSFLALPLLAWWLDRRRQRRGPLEALPPSAPAAGQVDSAD